MVVFFFYFIEGYPCSQFHITQETHLLKLFQQPFIMQPKTSALHGAKTHNPRTPKEIKSSAVHCEHGALELKFYEQFLRWNKMFLVEIRGFEVEKQTGLLGSQFISYDVEVNTDHLTYNLKRRYSDFRKLYDTIEKYQQIRTDFPKKTPFASKISPELSLRRQKLLNDLFAQILTKENRNIQVLIHFLRFLNLKDHYLQNNLSITIFSNFSNSQKNLSKMLEDSQVTFSYCISRLLQKLNICKEESLQNLDNLQNLVFKAKRTQVKTDDLRMVFIGDSSMQGILHLGLQSSNQLVCGAYMEVLKNFLTPEKCPYSEFFKKILESVPTRSLRFSKIVLDSQPFLESYFFVMKEHIDKKPPSCEKNILALREIFPSQKMFIYFKNWKDNYQGKCRSALRNTITQLVSEESMMDSFLAQIEKSGFEDRNSQSEEQRASTAEHYEDFYEQVHKMLDSKGQLKGYARLHKKSDMGFFEVSENLKFCHIHYEGYWQLKQLYQLIEDWKHNKIVTHWCPANEVKGPGKLSLKLPPKQQKIFKLWEKANVPEQLQKISAKYSIQTQASSIKNISHQSLLASITYLPPAESLSGQANPNSFFSFIGISEVEGNPHKLVDILYYFHSESIQKYFQTEMTGQSNYLWEGFQQYFCGNESTMAGKCQSFDTQVSLSDNNGVREIK